MVDPGTQQAGVATEVRALFSLVEAVEGQGRGGGVLLLFFGVPVPSMVLFLVCVLPSANARRGSCDSRARDGTRSQRWPTPAGIVFGDAIIISHLARWGAHGAIPRQFMLCEVPETTSPILVVFGTGPNDVGAMGRHPDVGGGLAVDDGRWILQRKQHSLKPHSHKAFPRRGY